jgi:hypothetical protein
MAESGWQQSAPPAPAGVRLGSPYFSALGEQCYEAYPEGGPASAPRAYCLRQGKWELLPDIYLSVPDQGGDRRP